MSAMEFNMFLATLTATLTAILIVLVAGKPVKNLTKKLFSKWVASISQPDPIYKTLPVQEILVREANNPKFRSLDHPRYGKGAFGFW